MATIANLMSEYTPLYYSLPLKTPLEDVKDKYDTMVDYLDYVQETPEEEMEEPEVVDNTVQEILPKVDDRTKTYKRVRNMTVIKPGKLKENAKIAYNYFVNHGIPAASAAGIVGNLYHEDLGNPLRTVKDSHGTIAYGIAGFNSGGDYPNLMAWARKQGIQGNPDFEQQLEYLTYVIKSGRDQRLTAVIMNPNSTPEDASYAWGRYYEVFGGNTIKNGKHVGYLFRDDPEHVKRGLTSAALYKLFYG